MIKVMSRLFLCFTFLLALGACNSSDTASLDRKQSPEAAFYLARLALHQHDLVAYFDTLTDKAVRRTLQNSIGICSASVMPEIQQYGYNRSVGCEEILHRYGWIEPAEREPKRIQPAWDKAIARIKDPRRMAVELETRHRDAGAGSSFVWSYLDPVTFVDLDIRDEVASARVMWSDEERRIHFERHETGWRFDPFPDI